MQVHHPRAQPSQRIPLPLGPGQDCNKEPPEGRQELGDRTPGQRHNRAWRVLLVQGGRGVAGVEGREVSRVPNGITSNQMCQLVFF